MPAMAQQPKPPDGESVQEVRQLAVYCGQYEAITALLRGAGGQTKAADGATAQGGRLELYRNETGLWTMVITFPEVGSCIIATGDSWSKRTSPEPEKQDRES